MLDLADMEKGRWPAVRASVAYCCRPESCESAEDSGFCRELFLFFDQLQEGYGSLGQEGKVQCGLDGVAFEISIQIDGKKRALVLDKLFKYADIDVHLFTEILQILRRHFPDYDLVVPTLQGYELAREIRRFLGLPELQCIFLKGEAEERLLMGDALRDLSYDLILEDTGRHYELRGGLDEARQRAWRGRELAMFLQGEDGEEAVLWMQVRIALSR
jgi:CheY-like chemotaxis protein